MNQSAWCPRAWPPRRPEVMPVEVSVSGSRDGFAPRPDWRSRLQAWRARQVARPGFPQVCPAHAAVQRLLPRPGRGAVLHRHRFRAKPDSVCRIAERPDRRRCRGPVTIKYLASTTGLGEDRLKRLLQAAQSIRLVRLGSDGFVTLADHGAVVQSDAGIRAMIRHHALLYRDLADPVGLFDGARTPIPSCNVCGPTPVRAANHRSSPEMRLPIRR
jgi:demethylspheroidene O-methyltransferase